jgi:hypothetical protein
MILAKRNAGDRSIKGEDILKPIFEESDANKDNQLNLEEWKVFSNALREKMIEKYGDSYSLTDE